MHGILESNSASARIHQEKATQNRQERLITGISRASGYVAMAIGLSACALLVDKIF